jgi:hypothetical protein
VKNTILRVHVKNTILRGDVKNNILSIKTPSSGRM